MFDDLVKNLMSILLFLSFTDKVKQDLQKQLLHSGYDHRLGILLGFRSSYTLLTSFFFLFVCWFVWFMVSKSLDTSQRVSVLKIYRVKLRKVPVLIGS